MRAVLDHLGIAVSDLQASLAFFKDVLGLHVESSEEIASQRVRATFLNTGQSTLEMLEATAPDSPIAKFVEQRGAGMHHVALRVDDIEAALAHLRSRGIRLIDEKPRPRRRRRAGCVHSSVRRARRARRVEAAGVEGRVVHEGRPSLARRFRVDHLVGRVHGSRRRRDVRRRAANAWEKRLPPDDANRIPLGMRPLIVRSGKTTVLIDAGCGDKMDPKLAQIYKLDRRYHLDHSLADAGLAVDDIDIVVASHLHFDHVGGFTKIGRDGALVPRFPKAKYIAHRAEWEDATHPHERNRASYLQENFVPLKDAGVLTLVDDAAEFIPGVRYRRSGGHTPNHQVVIIESGGSTAVFTADMYPTTVHIPDPWVMGFDLYPVDTLTFKRGFREGSDRARIPVVLRARPVDGRRIPAREGRESVLSRE
jgi:methylmalonyl-CoA epimerase